MKTKRIVRLLAAALAVLLAAAAFSACGRKGGAGDTGYTGDFNYLKSDLTKYVNFPKSLYTGQSLDLSSQYTAPEEYTMSYIEENFDTIIRELRYANRTGDAGFYAKSTPIGDGDDVYFYILEATVENGSDAENKTAEAVLCNAYESSPNGPFTIGYDTLLGEDFDAKIRGFVPKTTSLVKNTLDRLAEDDVVCMSYNFKPAKGESLTGAYARVALSSLLPEIRAALLTAFNEAAPFGEVLSFTATVGDVEYTCEANVLFIAEETAETVTFTVPQDFFAKDSQDGSDALNGKTITVKLIVPYTVDYELPEVNVAFFKETLGVETEETEYSRVVEAFKQMSLDKMNEEVRNQPETVKRQAFWNYLIQLIGQAQGSYLTTLPENEWNEEYSRAYQTRYQEYVDQYSAYYSTVDAYMYAAYGYSSLAEYAQSAADGGVTKMMLQFWIYREEGLQITKEEEEKLYTAYIDELTAAAEENRGERDHAVYNREYFEDRYGEGALRLAALQSTVEEIVTDYLMENNTVTIGTKSK